MHQYTSEKSLKVTVLFWPIEFSITRVLIGIDYAMRIGIIVHLLHHRMPADQEI